MSAEWKEIKLADVRLRLPSPVELTPLAAKGGDSPAQVFGAATSRPDGIVGPITWERTFGPL